MLEQKIERRSLLMQPPAIFRGPFARFENPIRRLARTVMRPLFRSGEKMFEYNHLDESLAELGDMLDENSLLVIPFSHISHSDVLAAIELRKAVRSRFPTVGTAYIPVAASLVMGLQGPIPQLLYSEGTKPLLDEAEIVPLPVPTENDRKKRGLSPNAMVLRKVIRIARENRSTFLNLAEGSVEGGRHDILGNEKGLQRLTNIFCPIIFQNAYETGRRIIVLPVGISGSNRIISADTIFLTLHSVLGLIEDLVFRRPSILATATVGQPFEYHPNQSAVPLTDIAQEINDIIMNRIALLKPPKERGYYHPVTRAYQQAIADFEKQHAKIPGLIRSLLVKFHLLPLPDKLKQLANEYSKLEQH